MNPALSHLAQRVADAPDFLACALAEFARSEKLDDDALAQRLRCSVDTLTHLRLCRTPRPRAPFFSQDVDQIASRFGVDAEILTEVVRRGQTLLHLRNPSTEHHQEAGFLLAARDEAPKENPPEGTSS
jgi:hypothetical protein